ncbi:tetratricopeptide repeat protein [Streptomyces sp. NPDC046900]|uniref:tetratricopeptide repeat protein n=1 Tax=Streptomyces sp. NPDC046900 TaxID=3155473 RepID=UPI0033CA3237
MLGGTAAVAAGAAIWTAQSPSTAPSDSKPASAAEKNQQANSLLQSALVEEQRQDSKGASHTYKRVVELDPGNKLAWYNLGVIAQRDGRTTDARAAYDKALKADPGYTPALYNKAMLLKSSEPDAAMELLRRFLAADPKGAAAHLQLGHILAEKHRDSEAEDEFRRAVAANPSLRSQVPDQFR